MAPTYKQMNGPQRSTRKALIGQVASLIAGTKPIDPKARRKRPFPGTPTTYVQGGITKHFPPEHKPVMRRGPATLGQRPKKRPGGMGYLS